MAKKAQDVMDKVAATIIESIEQGLVDGKWSKPWTSNGISGLPINASTGKPYSGGNVFALWITEMVKGYGTSKWATYKQWEAMGAQVRRGEEGTFCVKYTPVECRDHGKDEMCSKCGRIAINTFALFNAAQVDGYEAPAPVIVNPDERLAALDAYFEAIGAEVFHGATGAWYSPGTDQVSMPEFQSFKDADSYYATLSHELVHWTGHANRCGRDLSGRFGDNSYAMEELVA